MGGGGIRCWETGTRRHGTQGLLPSRTTRWLGGRASELPWSFCKSKHAALRGGRAGSLPFRLSPSEQAPYRPGKSQSRVVGRPWDDSLPRRRPDQNHRRRHSRKRKCNLPLAAPGCAHCRPAVTRLHEKQRRPGRWGCRGRRERPRAWWWLVCGRWGDLV